MSIHRNNIINADEKHYGNEWNGRPVEDYLLYHGLNPDKISKSDADKLIKSNGWSSRKHFN